MGSGTNFDLITYKGKKMKNYLKFKLHSGRVPYFVSEFVSIAPIDGEYYGINLDSTNCYVPPTLITLTEDEFKLALVTNAIINKEVDGEQMAMTTEEKTDYVNQWISKHPVS